jgi:hypothetical protein
MFRKSAGTSGFLSKDEVTRLEPEFHNGYAVYKNDVNITLARGRKHMDEYNALWLKKNPFPDKSVSSVFVDLYYAGQVMHRWIVVYMDGFREVILQPSVENVPGSDGDLPEDYEYFIPTDKMQLLRLLTGLIVSGVKSEFVPRKVSDMMQRIKMKSRQPREPEPD